MERMDRIETIEVSILEPDVAAQGRALSELGWGTRRGAHGLGVSRNAVKRSLRGATAGEQVRPRARRLDAQGDSRARRLFRRTC